VVKNLHTIPPPEKNADFLRRENFDTSKRGKAKNKLTKTSESSCRRVLKNL
tara:strand:+ start:14 stop:166 length:153 start_codon:yes stop_codon:yes gene_type:complete